MNSHAQLHHDVRLCANCHTALVGKFCHQCSQEATLHVPSAREFLHEFIGHYVALEGKLWKSLCLLVFRPGRLTREYIEGRRVRYVQPLRLYLSFSILFFALLKFGAIAPVRVDPQDGKASAPVQGNAAGSAATRGAVNELSLQTWLTPYYPALSAKVDKFMGLPNEEKGRLLSHAFYSYAPYAMFCLMPVFALYLKLLYLGSGRRYGEHLLFALHSNAFAFVMLMLQMMVPTGWGLLSAVLLLWLACYLPIAMRCVYGGSRLATGARWLVLVTLHMLSIAAAIIGALALAVLA